MLATPQIEMPLQRTAVTHWLVSKSAHQKGAILWNAMGVGKTLTAMVFLKNFPPSHFRIIVITPDHLIFSWENERRKFNLDFGDMKYVSYEDLFKNPRQVLVGDSRPLVVVVDECHHFVEFVKHGRASIELKVILLMALRDMPVKTLLLSGTPFTSEIADLRFLLFLCAPPNTVPISRQTFMNKYYQHTKTNIVIYGWVVPLYTGENPILAFLLRSAITYFTGMGIDTMIQNITGQQNVPIGHLTVVLCDALVAWCATAIALEDRSIPTTLLYDKFRKDAQQYVSFYQPDFLAPVTTPDALVQQQRIATTGVLRHFPVLKIHHISIPLDVDQTVLYIQMATNRLDDAERRLLHIPETVLQALHEQNSTISEVYAQTQRVAHVYQKDGSLPLVYSRALELTKGHRAVIWTQFDYAAHDITQVLGKAAVRLLSVPAGERAAVLDRFASSTPGTMCLVLDDKFSEGINVRETQRLILLDVPIDLGKFSQVIARVRRLHSHADPDPDKRVVHVYELASSTTTLWQSLRASYAVYKRNGGKYAPYAKIKGRFTTDIGPGSRLRIMRQTTQSIISQLDFVGVDISSMPTTKDTCCPWSPPGVPVTCTSGVPCSQQMITLYTPPKSFEGGSSSTPE